MQTKSFERIPVALLLILGLAGCGDILSLDNYDEPTSFLSGRVVFEGNPIGVRNNGVQLELWQPSYELNQKIPVHVHQDGTYSAALFDGSYKLNLLANNGPWVPSTDTISFDLTGQANIDFPVTPYYVVRDEQVGYDAGGGGPNGTIEATFRIGVVSPVQELEYVGLYVGYTTFVDRNNSINVPNEERERRLGAIADDLEANTPITISVTLPEDVYSTNSPAIREHVFVRIGVKTAGVSEMLFSPVYKVAI